jgi:ribosomal protein S18 acetylase RimI-like enzyme
VAVNADITIIRCDENHLEALREISISTFIDTYAHLNTPENVALHVETAYARNKLLEELTHPHIAFFFFFRNNNLVGYTKLCWEDTQTESMEERSMEIERIYVNLPYQGLGIGRLMVDHCKAFALKNYKTHLWLGVWEKNPEAIGFYKKVGFKPFGRHTFTVGVDVQQDILMEMNL